MLPEMTDEQREEYFRYKGPVPKDPGSNYMNDILAGKIHIWDVPFERRYYDAYIYACRSAHISPEAQAHLPDNTVAYRFSEQKLIENTLLSDIMESNRRGMSERETSLRRIYFEYFVRGGISAIGLI